MFVCVYVCVSMSPYLFVYILAYMNVCVYLSSTVLSVCMCVFAQICMWFDCVYGDNHFIYYTVSHNSEGST